jgi:uncharacterized protein YlxW (UPF0749 family)
MAHNSEQGKRDREVARELSLELDKAREENEHLKYQVKILQNVVDTIEKHIKEAL